MKISRILAIISAFFLFSLVAFAQKSDDKPYISKDYVYILSDDVAVLTTEKRGVLTQAIKPNTKVMFPIENAKIAEELEGLRVFTTKWELGEEFTGDPYIEYRMLYEADGITKIGYKYVAVLPVLSLGSEQKANVSGSITLGAHRDGNQKRKFSFVIRNDGTNPYVDRYICEGTDFPIEFDRNTHQVSLSIGSVGEFSVDAYGQPPINVGFSVEPYTDYIYNYPKAKLSFISFNYQPVFNRVGELTIYSEEGNFIYEITPKGLKEGEFQYNSEKKGFTANVRRLGEYIVSDKALDSPLKKNKIVNPPTGAG